MLPLGKRKANVGCWVKWIGIVLKEMVARRHLILFIFYAGSHGATGIHISPAHLIPHRTIASGTDNYIRKPVIIHIPCGRDASAKEITAGLAGEDGIGDVVHVRPSEIKVGTTRI